MCGLCGTCELPRGSEAQLPISSQAEAARRLAITQLSLVLLNSGLAGDHLLRCQRKRLGELTPDNLELRTQSKTASYVQG